MRAVAVPDFGAPARVVELPEPRPDAGEILVRIEAAALNPFEQAIAMGVMRPLRHVFPLVLGIDGAGVVEAVGAGVKRFAVGARVCGAFLTEPLGRGTLAEVAVTNADGAVVQAPATLTWLDAAVAPSAGMTALGLVGAAELQPGADVLIVGAAGGVGSYLVQLALARGVQVTAVARRRHHDALRELGAHAVVDPGTHVRTRADVLFDLVSDADGFAAYADLVRDGGRALSLRYAAGAPEGRIRTSNFNIRAHPDLRRLLMQIVRELESGRVRSIVGRVLSLDEAARFAIAPGGAGTHGKTAVQVSEGSRAVGRRATRPRRRMDPVA